MGGRGGRKFTLGREVNEGEVHFCGAGDKGSGYTRAKDEKTERGSMSTLELKELELIPSPREE